MSIVTDSTPVEAPKDPEKDLVFAFYKLLASPEQTKTMKANYLQGNYGYGDAKQALYELILEKFEEPRKKFDYYINHTQEVDEILVLGAEKAKKAAHKVLKRVREKLGY